jgi:hypothetical protein
MRVVGHFPGGGAVEFARLVDCCIKCVLALLAPLTIADSPWASLVSRHSL